MENISVPGLQPDTHAEALKAVQGRPRVPRVSRGETPVDVVEAAVRNNESKEQ